MCAQVDTVWATSSRPNRPKDERLGSGNPEAKTGFCWETLKHLRSSPVIYRRADWEKERQSRRQRLRSQQDRKNVGRDWEIFVSSNLVEQKSNTLQHHQTIVERMLAATFHLSWSRSPAKIYLLQNVQEKVSWHAIAIKLELDIQALEMWCA